MLHEGRPVPLSPSKGKAREETRWRTGWWDFSPLVEHESQRPLVWSETSVIFTAHPTRLDVSGRHFPSSKQFFISPPPLVNASPAQYSPPSFISIAPGDKYFFAFYPGKTGDGAGCIWRRGPRIDSWLPVDSWKFNKYVHPVAAEWLGHPRMWHLDASGSATRLPSRGPQTPVSSPTLLYVTSDHRANLCYLRHYYPLRVISCSLDQGGVTSEVLSPEQTIQKYASKQCTLASIGIAYGELSIIVATRIRSLPSQFSHSPQFNTTLDIPDNAVESNSGAKVSDWELWGEEEMIHLCELRLQFDGMLMSLHTRSLWPIQCPSRGMVSLFIVPSAQSLSGTSGIEDAVFHIIETYLDFGDYTSAPKSEVAVHTLSRSGSKTGPGTNQMSWNVRQEARRSFYPDVLCFFSPFFTESKNILCYVGFMKTSGLIPKKGSSKALEIGHIKVLRLLDLNVDDGWQTSSILSTIDRLGQELPLPVAISQNGVLLAIQSPWLPRASVHNMPKRKQSKNDSIPHHCLVLASAALLGKSTSDITHVLASPTVPMNEVVHILHRTAQLLDAHENGVPYRLTPSFMGIVVEMYKARMHHHPLEDEKEGLELRVQTLFDVLSLKAFNEAFEECREDDGSADLQSVWHLIGLAEFIVHFVENIVKESILWSHPLSRNAQTSLDAPSLLALAHPYAFHNLHKAVGHVAKLRTYIGSLPAGGEKETAAKSVLLDLVDCSGIDFAALDALLQDLSKGLSDLNADDCRLSIALCQPVPSMYPCLGNILRKICNSDKLNKPMLFIKPTDLIDGVQQLSLAFDKKDLGMDVVLKKPLVKQTAESVCLRCGGSSLLGADLFKSDVAIKWRMWEKMQMPRCVCYGFCMKANAALQI